MPPAPLPALSLHFLAHHQKAWTAACSHHGNPARFANFPAFLQEHVFTCLQTFSHAFDKRQDSSALLCVSRSGMALPPSLILLLSPLVLEISATLSCILISHLSCQVFLTAPAPSSLSLSFRAHCCCCWLPYRVEVQLGSINCFGGSARCGHELAPRWDQWQ